MCKVVLVSYSNHDKKNKKTAIYSLDQSVLNVDGFMIVKNDSLKPRLSVPDFVSQFFSKAMRQSPNRKHRFEAREIA